MSPVLLLRRSRLSRVASFCLFVVANAISACSSTASNSSLKHLSATMPACAVDPARSAVLYQGLSSAISGDTTAAQELADNWSTVPHVFTDFVMQRAQAGTFQIQLGGIGNGWIGLTTGGFDGSSPTLMQLDPNSDSLHQAAIHELGHAVEALSYTLSGNDPSAESQDVYNGYSKAMNSADVQSMWSYPQTNQYEWFASSFSQYWCSQDAQNYMKDTFPVSFAFFQNLYKGIGATPSTGGSSPGTGGQGGGLGTGGGQGGINDTTSGQQGPLYLALVASGSQYTLAGSATRIAAGQTLQYCQKASSACSESDWQSLYFTRNTGGRNIFTLPTPITVTDGSAIALRAMTGTTAEIDNLDIAASH